MQKTIHMLRLMKDNLGLEVAGIYCVPCECGKVYVGQTGRSIETRCKEHIKIHMPGPVTEVCCGRTQI
jgi:hypothetical protein